MTPIRSPLKFAVIGNPITHSLSPLLHRSVFKQLKLDAEFSKVECVGDELSNLINRLKAGDWNGINVTIPFKRTIIPFLDALNPRAKTIGSVNCVIQDDGFLTGYNTDWYGFSMLLTLNHVKVSRNSFIVLGAGGAAYSIVYALLREGAATVSVVNRTPKNSNRLKEKLSSVQGDSGLDSCQINDLPGLIRDASVIINTTPVGMGDLLNQSIISEKGISSSHTLIDIIYRPLKTEFLKLGEMAGAKIINGMDMFLYQGLASLDIWMKYRISDRVNVNELKKILESQSC